MEWFGNLSGAPGDFRFIVQPLIALILGLRDARVDALAGKPPYIFGLLKLKGERWARLKDLGHQVAVPFVVATILDAVLQNIVFGHWYLRTAIVMGTLLIAIPYAFARGMGNRLIFSRRRSFRRKAAR